jgi:hypothetical protein
MSKDDDWDDWADTWTPRKAKNWMWALLIILIVVPGIIWGATVLFSGPKGRGDQIIRNNSEVNRTGKQEMFEDLYADIKAYPAKIANAADQVKTNTDPSDTARLQSILTGMKNHCTDVVAQYNSESHKVTSEDWKDDRLPYEINASQYCGG